MLLVLALLVAGATTAHAYPQFQLALGTDRCTACHYSPAGGGLINDYGRDEAGGTISRGGDGRFLHGLWAPPSWLQLGADLRGATAFKRDRGSLEWLAFPMQVDGYIRAGGESLSVNVTVGLRGQAREPRNRMIERLVSREHYVMYERDGHYARAGRFFPVFGVRTQDHTAYVRRFMGFHTLEEPYGIAAGTFGDAWEGHVSLFTKQLIPFQGARARATGAIAYYERRFADDTAALAGQARFADTDSDALVTAGVVGKRWFADAGVMLLTELDLQRQSFDEAGATRYQLAGHLAASKFVVPGVMVGGGVHHWQPDLRLRTARDAFQLDVQYFPRAHFELHLLTRISGAAEFDDPSFLAFLQLHYYL